MKIVIIGGTGRIGSKLVTSKLVTRLRDQGHEAVPTSTAPRATYFGWVPSERSLMPGDGARIGEATFQAWQPQAVVRPSTAQPVADR